MTVSLEDRLLDSRAQFLRYVRSKVSDFDFAEDILQDALLKALRAAPDLQNEDRLIPWFYRVLRNAIVDAYRTKGVERQRMQPLEGIDVPDEQEEVAILCHCFEALLPALKPEYAELIRAELGNEPPLETASRMGITANNLKVRRYRARQALRVRLVETCRMCAAHGCLDCDCR
jgi:RNA polymerase sigma factor (sigma-70 family)